MNSSEVGTGARSAFCSLLIKWSVMCVEWMPEMNKETDRSETSFSSYGLVIQGVIWMFLGLFVFADRLGMFTGRIGFWEIILLFFFFFPILSTNIWVPLYPHHTYMFWSVKMRLLLNLVELTYFYGGGWVAEGRGWEMCRQVKWTRYFSLVMSLKKKWEEICDAGVGVGE